MNISTTLKDGLANLKVTTDDHTISFKVMASESTLGKKWRYYVWVETDDGTDTVLSSQCLDKSIGMKQVDYTDPVLGQIVVIVDRDFKEVTVILP